MKSVFKNIPRLNSAEKECFFEKAHRNNRKRYPKILHKVGDYKNEVFNFLVSGTYMQPHFHPSEEKIEHMTVVEGKICVLYFNELGKVLKLNHLNSQLKKKLSVPAFTWHTYIVMSPRAIVYEAMNGVYDINTWKTFSNWAPKEDCPDSKAYLTSLEEYSKVRM